MILEARLPGLFIDDQLPLLRIRPDEQRVFPFGHEESHEFQIRAGMKHSGVVRAGAPDLTIWHEPAEYDPLAHRRGAVVDGDLLAVDGD